MTDIAVDATLLAVEGAVSRAVRVGDANSDFHVAQTGAATQTTLAAVLAALGATVTVDGTVELGPVALAALETITAVVSGTVAVSNLPGTQAVSAVSLPLPSGAATSALQSGRYGGGKTPVVATVTASGDTTVHTPAAGKAVRLFWVSAINDPDEAASPLVKVKLGATEVYRAFAVAHWEIFEGVVDAPLVINLSGAASVAVTAHVQEFTP